MACDGGRNIGGSVESQNFSSESVNFTRIARLRASPRHGGAWRFKFFLVTDPPRGRPFGGGGVHYKWNVRYVIYCIPLAYFSDSYRDSRSLVFLEKIIRINTPLVNLGSNSRGRQCCIIM